LNFYILGKQQAEEIIVLKASKHHDNLRSNLAINVLDNPNCFVR
jgi:hypothetical protein